jgi:hypothetical protein
MSKNIISQSLVDKNIKNNNPINEKEKQNKTNNGNIYTYNLENLMYVGDKGEVIKTFSLNTSNVNTYSNYNENNRKSSPIRGGIINLSEKAIQNMNDISFKDKNDLNNSKNNNNEILNSNMNNNIMSFQTQTIYPCSQVNSLSINGNKTINKDINLNQKKTMLKSGNKIQTSITKTNNYSKSNPVSFSIKSKTTKTNYPFSISNNAVNIINNNKDKNSKSNINNDINYSNYNDDKNLNQNSIQQSININLNKDEYNLKSNPQQPIKSEFQKSFDAFLLEPHSSDNKYIFINNSDGIYQSKIVDIQSIKDLKEQFQKFLNNLGNRNKSPYIIPYNEFLKIISNNIENSNDLFFELKSFIERNKLNKYQFNSLIKTEKEKSLMILSSIRKNKEYEDFSENTPITLLDDKFFIYSVSRWIKYSYPCLEYNYSYPPNNEELKFEKEIEGENLNNEDLINKNNKALEEIEKVKKDLLNEFNKKDQESKKLKSQNQKLRTRKITSNEKKKKYQEKIKDKSFTNQITEKDYAYKPEIQRKINEWENRPFVSPNNNYNIYNNSLGNQKVNLNTEYSNKQQK